MKTKLLIIIILSALFTSCEDFVSVEEKPEAKDGSVNFTLKIIDSTNTMQAVYGRDYVDGATVLLQSNLQNNEYILQSDENGLVNVGNVVSGEYLIMVSRELTPEEMEIAYGEKKFQQKLVNSETGTIILRADNNDTVKVKLDLINTDSKLVISEIYACGPPEAGLYFHDKYIEVYNQSDEIQYLDGILVAVVYASSYTGENYVDDAEYIHSSSIWKFPGTGTDYPIQPGQFVVCAEDGMDHRTNAEFSVDLSNADFEFYKSDAPDIDYQNVPNMKMIHQPSGFDWLIGGESEALVIADFDADSLIWDGARYLIPTNAVLDGVEYLKDPTRLDNKTLYPGIDAGATGGIVFYTGKSMERKIRSNENGRAILKDDNNSSLDFNIYPQPSPQYHNEIN